MKNIKYLLILFFVLTTASLPQKKSLDLHQIILDRASVSPQELLQLNWLPDGEHFAFVKKENDNYAVFEASIQNPEPKQILGLSDFNDVLKKNKISSVSKFPTITWENETNFNFWNNDTLWSFSIKATSLMFLNCVKEDAENIDLTTDNKAAFTIKNNLFIASNGKSVQVTNDKNPGMVYGQIVSRNEFGISKGTFWSPKADYLAFYKKDESKVMDYPLVDISKRPAKLDMIKYPMAGSTSQHVSIGVYNVKSGKTIWLDTKGEWDQYLTSVSWTPDEKYILVSHLNRDQNHLRMIKYDASTGKNVKTLFEEKNPKYVQPLHGATFVKNHPDEFIWISRRDGWNHLYLYNIDGKFIKQLTKGKWEVTKLNGFDKNGENLFFTSTEQSPLDRDFYSVNIESEKISRLTKESGTHEAEPNDEGSYFLDTFNSLTVPNKVVIADMSGKEIKTLLTAENPLKEFNIGKTRIFKLKSNDGFDLYCRMITPSDFDSTKKYKTLVYVYGGPGIQLITNKWLAGAGLWLNYMAEQGYVVFTLDNRGSANRGLAFEQVTFRHLGTHEIEDQKLGVNYLKSLPYVDTTKLGVFGWSFGGFMTTSLMTRTPDLFKVGVCGGAVIDWEYYEVMYTERYMDTPQANPEGYKGANLLNYVQNLKGKLLELHGTMDPVVLWQNTLMLAKKAAVLGVPLDYYPYPGWPHHIGLPDQYQMYDKITRYFNTNL